MRCCSSPPADKPADSAKPAEATNKGLDGVDRKCKDVLFLLLFIVAWAGKLSAASLCWHVAHLRSSTRRRSLRAAHSGAIWVAVRGLQKGNPNILIKGNPSHARVLFGLGPAHCAFCTGYDFLGRVCGEGVMP